MFMFIGQTVLLYSNNQFKRYLKIIDKDLIDSFTNKPQYLTNEGSRFNMEPIEGKHYNNNKAFYITD